MAAESMLAQLAPLEDVNLWNLVVNLGCFGLVAWLLVFGMPRQARAEREERAERDRLFLDAVDKLNRGFVERQGQILAEMDRRARELAELITRGPK